MDLLQEYAFQQQWRGWERYLEHIPLRGSDTVLDLGCSVGEVSRLLSPRVKNVIGIDINQEFIDFCRSMQGSNEEYLCADLLEVDYLTLVNPQLVQLPDEMPSSGKIDGVWASFSLSYLSDPRAFLQHIGSIMSDDGWIALVGVACFISGNMSPASIYFDRVKAFELRSAESGVYDFNFGSKMPALLASAGFTLVYFDADVVDPELNCAGAVCAGILDNWRARLGRMSGLRQALGEGYSDFCEEMLANLGSASHEQRGNVRFVVAKKIHKGH